MQEATTQPQPYGNLPTRKRWSRKRKLAAIAASILALTTATAVALLLLRAPINGSGSVSVPSGIEFVAASVVRNGDGITCTASLPSPGGTATVNVNGQAGTSCDVRFVVRATGSDVSARLQGFRWSTVTEDTFLEGACGQAVPVGNGGVAVLTRIAIPANAPAGSLSAQADAGLEAVDGASWAATSCP